MWDYDGNKTAKDRRVNAIKATYKLRREAILARYDTLRTYLLDQYGTPYTKGAVDDALPTPSGEPADWA